MAEQRGIVDGATGIDVDGGDAQRAQLGGDAGAQVQPRGAAPGGRTAARQRPLDVGSHLIGNLVVGAADRRAEQDRHVFGACPGVDHDTQRLGDDPLRRTDSARVHRADHPGAGVGQQYRHAVGGDHRERQSWCGGDQTVRGIPGATGVGHHLDVGAVDLVHPDDPVVAQPGRRGEPVSVRRDRGRVVADVVAEVEAVERRPGHSARAGGRDAPDPQAGLASRPAAGGPSIKPAAGGRTIKPAAGGRTISHSVTVGRDQWRMNGGTSTSSSEMPPSSPPIRTVAPLVCTGTLAGSEGSNSDELTRPALPGVIGVLPVAP